MELICRWCCRYFNNYGVEMWVWGVGFGEKRGLVGAWCYNGLVTGVAGTLTTRGGRFGENRGLVGAWCYKGLVTAWCCRYFNNYGGDAGVSFLKWMLLAFPLSLMMFALCWVWLVLVFLRG